MTVFIFVIVIVDCVSVGGVVIVVLIIDVGDDGVVNITDFLPCCYFYYCCCDCGGSGSGGVGVSVGVDGGGFSGDIICYCCYNHCCLLTFLLLLLLKWMGMVS